MLTNNENIRVRSAAVNALGKLKIDPADSQFTANASQRLRELAGERSIYKMLNKDIAFALKNINQPPTFLYLLK
ncbi:MAG: hypothetical protein IPH77_18505 [Ignavibacteria bacterium]|nr:hypothetical protein [Ignavibacteria bacterium]